MRVEDLKVGDMVSCKMDAVLMNVTHRGIYVGYTAQEGRHSVVHNFCGEGKKKQGGGDGGVMIWSMAKFKEYAIGGWWVENGPTPYTGEQIAQRALSRVGERNYHTMSNNCEHFAYWCRYNAANSPQVIGSIAMPLVPVVKSPANGTVQRRPSTSSNTEMLRKL
uniref:LRAT domain-containing protein n=1 Tax=Globodera rostochiensis TaxID=31243 RepID=A0A914GVR5_GLORO